MNPSLATVCIAVVSGITTFVFLISLYVLMLSISFGEIFFRSSFSYLKASLISVVVSFIITAIGVNWFHLWPLTLNIIFGISIPIFLHLLYFTFKVDNIVFLEKVLAFIYNFLGFVMAVIWFTLPSQFIYIGSLFGLITFFMGLYRW
jgi:hypothetical protein